MYVWDSPDIDMVPLCNRQSGLVHAGKQCAWIAVFPDPDHTLR